ncbi:histamine N-methyltransferase-like [Antennarius striatus]|uniref:histamine N-methyltransferase-like n=1 Tax=Antennarius striatus TaxID=241820 RepID=UPI0035B0B4F9
MAFPLPCVYSDGSRYLKAYEYFHKCSGEHQGMVDFFNNHLPDIMSSAINDNSVQNVLGFGCGSGPLDLEMFSAIHRMYPKVTVDYEVVDPTVQFINQYKDLLSKTSGFDYIKWNWTQLTVQEFEKENKERTKKADMIHLFQSLYYVKEPGPLVNFLQSLLSKNGKLLISLISGNCGWAQLEKKYFKEISDWDACCSFSDDIRRYLDANGQRYQTYVVPCQIDVTECFIEGDENGGLLLDFLTEVLNFDQTATPELRAGVLELFRDSKNSVESNGRIMLGSEYEVIAVDQLI